MNDFVQVIVRGDAAPESYEDFSVMLESSLAPVARLNYVICIDVSDRNLSAYLLRYVQEMGLKSYFGGATQPKYPVAHLVLFLKANYARSLTQSFDIGPAQSLPRPPTVFLF